MFMAMMTAFALSLATSSPANAALTGLCWPTHGSSTGARLSVTKYADIYGRPGYDYHIGVISKSPLAAKGYYVDGVFTNSNDNTPYYAGSSAHTIKGRWFHTIDGDSDHYDYCSVRL